MNITDGPTELYLMKKHNRDTSRNDKTRNSKEINF